MNAFGPLLREWRQLRQMSQLRLAEAAEVSTRHISFIETGRAAPSREMVLILASALDLPLRERNTLLGAAGFAAVYRETDFGAPEMSQIARALEFYLERHEPYGAAVLDGGWNILRINRGGMRMLGWFLDQPPPPLVASNAIRMLFHPRGLRPFIANWEEQAGAMIERLHREAQLGAGRALLDEILAYPDMPPRFARPRVAEAPQVVLNLHLRKHDRDLRLFTTLTTLGTPLDVTAQELRIESYFPADEVTEEWVRSLET
ncbi:MAG TPA: helix-turn-helix transcriptional regulator [Kofleriaceae bacterium]|nr:helix-turn-helix transcriptional regulator [Kofleriaceae bacterium]